MKKLFPAAAGLFLIAVCAYVGSPYFAVSNLKSAALSGDANQIETKVDFPAVRDSLKSQISTAMMQKLNADPEMKDNPFAGLGMMMMPAIVDKAVDAYLTPDGVAAMVRGSKPNDVKSQTDSGDPRVDYDSEWVNSDRFRVNLTNTKTQQAGPTLVFERRGIVTWKLTQVDLGENFLDN